MVSNIKLIININIYIYIIKMCFDGDEGIIYFDSNYDTDKIIKKNKYIAIKCPYCPNNKQMIILEDCVMFAETTNICCVCQDAKANVFLPCRHVLFCKDCALIMDGK
jgi:hypothetical protein